MNRSGRWRWVAASSTGTSHRRDGRGCEDAWRFREAENLWVWAVADGAGSVAHGRLGASLAVNHASAAMVEGLSTSPPAGLDQARAVAAGAVASARDVVATAARTFGLALPTLASTLLVVACGRFGMVSAQVGDGAILACGPEGWLNLTPPRPAEYLNITDFLTSPDWAEALKVTAISDRVSGLALMTDGTETLAVHTATGQPAPGFVPRLHGLLGEGGLCSADLSALLASPSVGARTDDDLTLVVAHQVDDRPDPAAGVG